MSLAIDNPIVKENDVTSRYEHQNLKFFSGSEAHLCTQILREVYKNTQTIFIALPAYAQDAQFAQRIGHYVQISNTHSVIIDAQNFNIKQIMDEYIHQLGLEGQGDIYSAFGKLITDYFKHDYVLTSVIYNAQALGKQDFDYLYELSSLIYEKFPKQRHKVLMRFIFIADHTVAPILRKKTGGKLCRLNFPKLSITECINALYLFTPVNARTKLFYQTINKYAQGLLKATAGYPALMRQITPLPEVNVIAGHKDPAEYLGFLLDQKLPPQHINALATERLQSHKYVKPLSMMHKITLFGIMPMMIVIFMYYFFINY